MSRIFIISLLASTIAVSCTQEGDTYVTNITSPEDWHPPVIEWHTQPEPEVRGTVGLDFGITDSSEIVAVRAYLNGAVTDSDFTTPYRFELITDSLFDGVHLVEIRATDTFGNLGISPILRINVMNSVAQGPQLIWVPDRFARIQDAINAATDFDTIRVRPGTYYETLNTFGKGIWLESELGPTNSRINGIASNSVFTISPSSEIATIRGFWLEGAERLVRYELGGQANIYNNIILDDTASALFYTTYSGGAILNNYFKGSETGVNIGYHWGVFFNNAIQNVTNIAFWDAAIATNPLVYGYTIFWNNGTNYGFFEPGQGDFEADPLVDLVAGRLMDNSPAINTGNPEISDLDSSRSDIGPFGGLWAYIQ